MWFGEIEGTSYVLILSVLIILAIFALVVFGSLPCSCKYIILLNHCLWKKRDHRRVADSSRRHVIGSSAIEVESLPRYPGYPFAIATTTTTNNPITASTSRSRTSTGSLDTFEPQTGGLTLLALAPRNLFRYHQQHEPYCYWDEPPPSYHSLFPAVSKDKPEKKSYLPAEMPPPPVYVTAIHGTLSA